jgi:hypothetical protein
MNKLLINRLVLSISRICELSNWKLVLIKTYVEIWIQDGNLGTEADSVSSMNQKPC